MRIERWMRYATAYTAAGLRAKKPMAKPSAAERCSGSGGVVVPGSGSAGWMRRRISR
jgi:hypothetical protein